jgi:hypothetical protein
MIIAEFGNVTICGPGETYVIREDREDPRWCFGCRARHGGAHRLISEVGMSYYDPWWQYACDGCGDDCRLGFGMVWTGEDE